MQYRCEEVEMISSHSIVIAFNVSFHFSTLLFAVFQCMYILSAVYDIVTTADTQAFRGAPLS